MSDSDDNLRLEIGHVLFIDIVGYSRLLIEEQKERLNQLTEIVLATAQVREASEEQLVRLPTGDGMALVFRHSPEEPARCALEIAEALRKHPELPVRMGIHSGPVSEVTDVSGRTNIAGAGINMAQRVMDCGDTGHILLSQHVADDLMQYRQWAPRLHDLGDCEVKPGVRLHLVNLYAEQLGNSELPKKLATAKRTGRNRRSGLIAALVLVALLAAGAAYYLASNRPTKGAAIPEKSIAVLPLVNSTGDPANEYFSDGMSEEFISSLSRLQRPQGHRAHLVFSVQRQDGGQQDSRRKAWRPLPARGQRAQVGRSGAHRGGAGESGRWQQRLVGNLRPRTEGHLRSAIGDCRRGGEAAQGRAARH